MVIETDLDDTFVQYLGDQYEFNHEKAHQLEQQRMEKFSAFARLFSDMLILVYNTSRSPTGTFSSGSQQKYKEIGLDVTEAFAGGEESGMVFNDLDQARTKWLLPVPDILITEVGSHVDSPRTTAESGVLSRDESRSLTEKLLGWVKTDRPDMEKFKPYMEEYFNKISYTRYNNCLKFKSDFPRPRWSVVKESVEGFHRNCPECSVAFVPRMFFAGSTGVDTGIASLASVNKGSTFRIVIEKLIEKRRALGKSSKAMVFVFGDSSLDLSMIRPDLEIEAFELIGTSAIALRDTRFQELVVLPLNPLDLSWWELSIVPEKSDLGRGKCCGPYVDSVMNHRKIEKSKGWGVASLIRKTVEHIKENPPESVDGIPVPKGFFDDYLNSNDLFHFTFIVTALIDLNHFTIFEGFNLHIRLLVPRLIVLAYISTPAYGNRYSDAMLRSLCCVAAPSHIACYAPCAAPC